MELSEGRKEFSYACRSKNGEKIDVFLHFHRKIGTIPFEIGSKESSCGNRSQFLKEMRLKLHFYHWKSKKKTLFPWKTTEFPKETWFPLEKQERNSCLRAYRTKRTRYSTNPNLKRSSMPARVTGEISSFLLDFELIQKDRRKIFELVIA